MLKTIAILSTGDMDHAVGRVLGEAGHEIITSLAGRSKRTRGLAAAGGIADVAEMEEIASTFRSAGLPTGFHEAAAAIYELMGETEFASETPETLDRSRSLWETIAAMDDQISKR